MTTHVDHDGQLAYRLRPATGPAHRLLVLCHGVGGNETNLAALATDVPDDTAVVLARAPLTLGPGQYAWFPVVFGPTGPRPDLAAAEASRVRLAKFIEVLQSTLAITPDRTAVAGFSQGGIMSASVALTRPDLVAGFGVLAGRILPELEPRVAGAEALRHLRAFIGHGRDDSKLPVDWAHRADAWLERLRVHHELRLYAGDHGISPTMQADFLAWFDALPTRVAAAP